MKILIIGDELSRLKIQSDTSLDMAKTFVLKKHEVFWATPKNLRWSHNNLLATAQSLSFKNEDIVFGEAIENEISSFQWVLIRKDPPFDEEYVELCWMLVPYQNKIQFLNMPSLLLRYHEKMIPLECLKEGAFSASEILTITTVRTLKEVELEIQKSKDHEWVLKPFLGHGGEEIHLFERTNLETVSSVLKGASWILQPLEESVRSDGDFRAFFIDGQYVGGFLRKPAEKSIVSNLAQGGSALDRELSSEELQLLSRLSIWLKEKGFFLAGADLIGGKISEVNVTSPTGFKTFFKLKNISLAEKCLLEMEKRK